MPPIIESTSLPPESTEARQINASSYGVNTMKKPIDAAVIMKETTVKSPSTLKLQDGSDITKSGKELLNSSEEYSRPDTEKSNLAKEPISTGQAPSNDTITDEDELGTPLSMISHFHGADVSLLMLARTCINPDLVIIPYQRNLLMGSNPMPPNRFLSNLAQAFAQFWESCSEFTGKLVHMNKSLEFAAKAKELLVPESDARLLEDFLIIWSIEAQALIRRFELAGNLNDIEQSIVILRHGLDRLDGKKLSWNHKTGLMNNLGVSLQLRFERLGDLADLDSAILMHQQLADLTPNGHANKPNRLSSLGNSLQARFGRLGDLADLNYAILIHQQAVDLTRDGHPDKPTRLSNLGISLLARFHRLGDLEDLHNSILKHQQAVDLTPDGHHQKPVRLNNLGVSLYRRFERLGDAKDLNQSILIKHQAVDLTPDSLREKPGWLINLGNSLLTRYELMGVLADLDDSISRMQQAVDLTPNDHSEMAARLTNLGNSSRIRYKRLGDLEDLGAAIRVQQKAVDLTPDGHINKASRLTNLGSSLLTQFERLGDLVDLNNSILRNQEAVDLTPGDDVKKPSLLGNLGVSLLRRFERLGNLADLDSSILQKQQAVDLTPEGHPDKPSRLNNLGISLLRRFDRLGVLADLSNSIYNIQQAVDLALESHTEKPSWLNSLGVALFTRFERRGYLEDINNSILMQQQAAELTTDDHPDKPSRLINLGNSLRARFQRQGNLVDLDSSILFQQQAVVLTPDGHAEKPSWLNNLGISLRVRFERLGDLKDLSSSILAQQQAVDLTPDGHAKKPSVLTNLGNSLQARFERLSDLADLNNSILTQQQAVDLTPDGHPDKPFRLHNLGSSLHRRFELQKNSIDLNNSILSKQQAVDLVPDDHPQRPALLNNLGNSLLARFDQLEDLMDLDNSILMHQLAVDLIPDGHASKPGKLYSLGNALSTRYEHFGNTDNFNRLISAYREAAVSLSGNPSLRFEAATRWAKLLYPNLEPYSTVIALIPQIIWLGRTIEQRYNDLQMLGAAVLDAVSAACAAGEYDIALEWFEQGRAIIWGQIFLLRSPMDDLKIVHPELAEELSSLAGALETAGSGAPDSDSSGVTPSQLEQAAQEHRRLAEKWESLLTTIRELPDFTNFLKPKSASVLKKASANKIIVIVNVSVNGSDALILCPGSPSLQHVRLSLSFKNVDLARKTFLKMLHTAGVRARGAERGTSQSVAQGSLLTMLKMLWTDFAKPILDHLGYSARPDANDLPHITWCPNGPLACLPIHAAGLYSNPSGQDKLFNYVVSSYTPSLASLLEGLEKTPTSIPSMLGVTQSDTPRLPALPGTEREVNQVEDLMKKHGVGMTRLDSNQATIEAVSEAMNKHNWVHFSCHGKQNAVEPRKSAFSLHNGELELAEIMKKPLKQAELAYLSACQTASGDAKLPDEAMHLAAGMFTAGYRSVVATLWSIKDAEAPLVALTFYDHLMANPEGGVARALHAAVAALRASKGNGEKDFISWVAYIHIGH